MPESYYGYVPKNRGAKAAAFTEALTGLGEDIQGAIDVRKNERKAYDDLAEQNINKIDEYESKQTKTYNELTFQGANKGRAKIAEMTKKAKNGEITQADYKLFMNNMQKSWGDFGVAVNSFDTRNTEILARQQIDPKTNRPPASVAELSLLDAQNKLADFEGAEYTIADNGMYYLTKKDAEGNIIKSTGSRQVNNPDNLFVDNVNVNDAINGVVKNMGDWKVYTEGVRGSSVTVEDMRNNPVYATQKRAVINALLTSNKSVVSVLMDNGGENYDTYTNEEEYNNAVEKYVSDQRIIHNETSKDGEVFNEAEARKYKEKRMIEIAPNEKGDLDFIITDDLRTDAEDLISNTIESQVGFSKTGTPKRAPQITSGGGSNKGFTGATAAAIDAGWAMKDKKLARRKLMEALLPGHKIDWDPNKNHWVLKKQKFTSKDGYPYGDFVPAEIISNKEQLAKYSYKGGVGKNPLDQYHKDKNAGGDVGDPNDPLSIM
jgi:hypothetical protein